MDGDLDGFIASYLRSSVDGKKLSVQAGSNDFDGDD
jgi:hypothetical protein